MFRMTTQIAVQMIPHMDQLLRDHDFQSSRLGQVDAVEIDEDRMGPGPPEKAVRPTVR